jgi:hypothetical protein
MAKKTVLAIGIDPCVVDFSAFPGMTVELVRNYIDAQIERLRSLGFEAEAAWSTSATPLRPWLRRRFGQGLSIAW